MSRKIAVMFATPMTGSIDYLKRVVENHYRYILFERKEVVEYRGDPLYAPSKPEVVTHSNLLLRYEDKSIEELLNELTVEFGVNRNFLARKAVYTREDGKTLLGVRASISGTDTMIAHPLGEFLGYRLYVIYKHSATENRSALYSFHVKSVPHYGRSCVIYDPEIARRSLRSVNLTGTIHEDSSDGTDLEALFDHMDALIAPVMKPFVDLLPPPREDS